MNDDRTAVAAKADPAHFELRSSAPRPIRIRRGALIGLSGAILVLMAGIAMVALRKPMQIARIDDDSGRPADAAAASDALASAPSSYAKVPVLGPPLTGVDMLTGKPGSLQTSGPMAAPAENADKGEALPSAEPKAAEIQRSAILLPLGPQPSPASTAGTQADPATLPVLSSMALSQPSASVAVGAQSSDDANRQDHKSAFVHAGNQVDGVNPHVLTPAASPWIVSAGSIISASLITGLNSDLPGEMSAQVTENVFDSPTGQTLLIPQGARLIGSNDNVVSFGQKRALIVWRRLIMPDGSSIQLDNWPAADKSGYTGLADSVDSHNWQLVKGVLLSTLLGIGTELSNGSSDSDLARALRQSVETGSNRAGEQLVGKSLDVQPTIRVRPGWPVRVVVHQDLMLKPWTSQGAVPVK